MLRLTVDLMQHIRDLPFPEKVTEHIPRIYIDIIQVFVKLLELKPLKMLAKDLEIFLQTYVPQFLHENGVQDAFQWPQEYAAQAASGAAAANDTAARNRGGNAKGGRGGNAPGGLTFALPQHDAEYLSLEAHFERKIKEHKKEREFSKLLFEMIKSNVPEDQFIDYAKMRFLALLTMAQFFFPRANGKTIEEVWTLLFNYKFPSRKRIHLFEQNLSLLRQGKPYVLSHVARFGMVPYTGTEVPQTREEDAAVAANVQEKAAATAVINAAAAAAGDAAAAPVKSAPETAPAEKDDEPLVNEAQASDAQPKNGVANAQAAGEVPPPLPEVVQNSQEVTSQQQQQPQQQQQQQQQQNQVSEQQIKQSAPPQQPKKSNFQPQQVSQQQQVQQQIQQPPAQPAPLLRPEQYYFPPAPFAHQAPPVDQFPYHPQSYMMPPMPEGMPPPPPPQAFMMPQLSPFGQVPGASPFGAPFSQPFPPLPPQYAAFFQHGQAPQMPLPPPPPPPGIYGQHHQIAQNQQGVPPGQASLLMNAQAFTGVPGDFGHQINQHQ